MHASICITPDRGTSSPRELEVSLACSEQSPQGGTYATVRENLSNPYECTDMTRPPGGVASAATFGEHGLVGPSQCYTSQNACIIFTASDEALRNCDFVRPAELLFCVSYGYLSAP